MGWRFRKSISVVPGLRLNFSKSGVSTSIDASGATMNIGPRGTRTTVGIPGTGISHSLMHTENQNENGSSAIEPGPLGCGCLTILALMFAFFVAQCDNSNAPVSVAPSSKIEDVLDPARGDVPNETVYVQADALNGRTGPSTSARVSKRLSRGDSLRVVERRGDWAKVISGAATVWVALRHVASSPPQPRARSARPATLYSRPSRSSKLRSNRYIDGTCPCSGSQVCIGPRGGRYCITSGGNKRYGV